MDRGVFAFDEFGPLAIRPLAGASWALAGHPDRLPANYHKLLGVRQFHGCYSVGDDHPQGPQDDPGRPPGRRPIYVILDNLSAHQGVNIRAWAARNRVELCFTPTYASWAKRIETQFGP